MAPVQARPHSAILGAGVTGLAAGWTSGRPVYEAEAQPGGLCASYYARPQRGGAAYRFEKGGGHWIFGGDPAVLRFLGALAPMRSYERRAAVYFPDQRRLAPYPLQNHLSCLEKDVAAKALKEILGAHPRQPETLADWLQQTFGPTLMKLFFAPFHELYTAGLWTRIAPQDAYKSPIDPALVKQGARGRTPAVGYSASFLYPEQGLDALVGKLAQACRLHLVRKVARIKPRRQEVQFADGGGFRYERLLATLPLNRMVTLAGLQVDEEPDPSTAVLVLNLGAVRGPACPQEHWLYVPRSRSRFHRVGFYSNVDPAFAPSPDKVGIYVERAYRDGRRPSAKAVETFAAAAVRELQQWGFIGEAEVVSATWIDVAYTWKWPGSRWRARAEKLLAEHGILLAGRFGQWRFQGIADSVGDGLLAGAALRAAG